MVADHVHLRFDDEAPFAEQPDRRPAAAARTALSSRAKSACMRAMNAGPKRSSARPLAQHRIRSQEPGMPVPSSADRGETPNIACGSPSSRAVQAMVAPWRPIASASSGPCPAARHSSRSIARIRAATSAIWPGLGRDDRQDHASSVTIGSRKAAVSVKGRDSQARHDDRALAAVAGSISTSASSLSSRAGAPHGSSRRGFTS